MTQRQMQFDNGVASRVEQLLQRCGQLKRASTLKPTRFNREGQQHAQAIAERDQVSFSGTSTRSHE